MVTHLHHTQHVVAAAAVRWNAWWTMRPSITYEALIPATSRSCARAGTPRTRKLMSHTLHHWLLSLHYSSSTLQLHHRSLYLSTSSNEMCGRTSSTGCAVSTITTSATLDTERGSGWRHLKISSKGHNIHEVHRRGVMQGCFKGLFMTRGYKK